MKSDPIRSVYANAVEALTTQILADPDRIVGRAEVERMRRLAGDDQRLQLKVWQQLDALRKADRISGDAQSTIAVLLEQIGGEYSRPVVVGRSLDSAEAPNDQTSMPEESSDSTEMAPPMLRVPTESLPPRAIFQTAARIREFGSHEPWQPMPFPFLRYLVEQMNPVDGAYRLDIATTEMWIGRLPFYDDVLLLRIVDASWANDRVVLYYFMFEDKLYRLNGQSLPIHQLNEIAPLKLSMDNVLDYLRFFCFFVNGEEGPFYISEDISDPMIPSHTDPRVVEWISGAVKPAVFKEINESGHFILAASVFYGGAIFHSNFEVQPGGFLEMLNDEPLTSDLPVRVVAPLD